MKTVIATDKPPFNDWIKYIYSLVKPKIIILICMFLFSCHEGYRVRQGENIRYIYELPAKNDALNHNTNH